MLRCCKKATSNSPGCWTSLLDCLSCGAMCYACALSRAIHGCTYSTHVGAADRSVNVVASGLATVPRLAATEESRGDNKIESIR